MAQTLVSLIRGINVAGHNRLTMQALRDVFGSLGFGDPETYLQSGNVVFTAERMDSSRIEALIAKGIKDAAGHAVSVLVRTAADLDRVVTRAPFLEARGEDPKALHVTFLSGAPPSAMADSVSVPPGSEDEFLLDGREIYVFCPNGYGRTKLSNTFFEKRLGVRATTRNWRSVVAIRDLARERKLG